MIKFAEFFEIIYTILFNFIKINYKFIFGFMIIFLLLFIIDFLIWTKTNRSIYKRIVKLVKENS